MALNIDIPKPETLKPKITIFGVGGAGGNAINNMINSGLEGVEFVAANTDAQALEHSLAENKIQLGEATTKGLGAGSFPDRGRAAAEENVEEIEKLLEGNHMVFIAAGMGGGTGTGAAPVIAKLAKDKDILTVGVVTKPFHFEGKYRMDTAENGMEELKRCVDTLIVIPNQNLFRIANERTTFESAFKMADDVLNAGVRGVTDLITMPGLVNLDFADIRTVMTKMGKAMMGTGEAEGENRAVDACEAAISNPLLDDISIRGAKGVLVNMTGGPDMTLFEADMAVNTIKKEVDDNANIIFGSAFDENMKGKIRISVVATGIDEEEYRQNIIRETTSSNSSSRFRSIDDDLDEKTEEKSFFDPGKTTTPEKKIAKISANDFQTESRFQEEENLDYGKADKKSSEKKIQKAISQISFFNDDSKNEEKTDLEVKEESPKLKKFSKSSKKEKDSGFSLFSFMSSSSKEDDVNEVQLDEDQEKNLENLINKTKTEEDQQSTDSQKEKKQDQKEEKKVEAKIIDLDNEDSADEESEDQDKEPENDNSTNDNNIEKQEQKIAEKEISLEKAASGGSSRSSSDDVLNVPAFFRRKNK